MNALLAELTRAEGLEQLAGRYGYPVYTLLMFVGSAGVPLPLGALLIALGAYSNTEQGLNLALLAAFGTLATIGGDTVDYGLGRLGGRFWGAWLTQRLHSLRESRWAQAVRGTALLDEPQVGGIGAQGGALLFLTRFFLTPLSLPVSLLAGMQRMRPEAFLLGEVVYVVGNLAIGRWVGAAIVAQGTWAILGWGALSLITVAPLALTWRRRPAKVGAHVGAQVETKQG